VWVLTARVSPDCSALHGRACGRVPLSMRLAGLPCNLTQAIPLCHTRLLSTHACISVHACACMQANACACVHTRLLFVHMCPQSQGHLCCAYTRLMLCLSQRPVCFLSLPCLRPASAKSICPKVNLAGPLPRRSATLGLCLCLCFTEL